LRIFDKARYAKPIFMANTPLQGLLSALLIGITLSVRTNGQPMLTFPQDTIIAEGCEDLWALDTRLFGLNLTHEPFRLYWWETQETYPGEGFTGLIIDGLQYPPSLHGGSVLLDGEDSVEVVFALYPEHPLSPGDTILYQIVVLNREDSLGTAMLLTCVVVCPETTRTDEAEQQPGISIFPNPSNGDITLFSDAISPGNRFDIYTLSGRRLHSLPAAEAGSRIDVHDLSAGAYIVCLVGHGRILNRQTLVITP
jgi:hypothetical protein